MLLGGAELLRTISRKASLESLLKVVVLGLKPANLLGIDAVFSEDFGSSWIWIPDWRGQSALRSSFHRSKFTVDLAEINDCIIIEIG